MLNTSCIVSNTVFTTSNYEGLCFWHVLLCFEVSPRLFSTHTSEYAQRMWKNQVHSIENGRRQCRKGFCFQHVFYFDALSHSFCKPISDYAEDNAEEPCAWHRNRSSPHRLMKVALVLTCVAVIWCAVAQFLGTSELQIMHNTCGRISCIESKAVVAMSSYEVLSV